MLFLFCTKPLFVVKYSKIYLYRKRIFWIDMILTMWGGL